MSPGAKVALAIGGVVVVGGVVVLATTKKAKAAPLPNGGPVDVVVPPNDLPQGPPVTQVQTPVGPVPIATPQVPSVPVTFPIPVPDVLASQQPGAGPLMPPPPATVPLPPIVPPSAQPAPLQPVQGGPPPFVPPTPIFTPTPAPLPPPVASVPVVTPVGPVPVAVPPGPAVPVVVPVPLPDVIAAQQPGAAPVAIPPPVIPGPVPVPPVLAPAPGVASVSKETAAMVASLLAAETQKGWNLKDIPEVRVWQASRGLVADGAFGPKSALTVAAELGSVPIIRSWPKGSIQSKAVADYQTALFTLAASSPDPARADALRFSAKREKGQSFGQTAGKAPAIPLDLQMSLAKVA